LCVQFEQESETHVPEYNQSRYCVEDSVIKENRPLLLKMHARVIERMFTFFSRHVTFLDHYQDVFPT